LLAALQHDLLHRPVIDEDLVEAVEVLQDPRALRAALDLGVAARDVGVRQVDVAGRLAADEEAVPLQLDAAPAPLGVGDLEVLHESAPCLPGSGVQAGERLSAPRHHNPAAPAGGNEIPRRPGPDAESVGEAPRPCTQ